MLGERFGHNVRYAAIGSAVSTALFGVVGTKFSDRAVFDVAAAFGVVALAALHRIRANDLATAAARTDHHSAAPRVVRRNAPQSPRGLLHHHRLVALLGAVGLFQLGNASILPLAAGRFAGLSGSGADLIVAGAVLVPQLIAALLSPWFGALAHLHGRRIFMLGLSALPLRAFVFAASSSLPVMLAAQWLDGICAATMGVMIPLIVADLTHRGGRFNLVLAMMGLSSSIGATLSTGLGGAIAQFAGLPIAFLGLAIAGLCAVLVVWAWLPETAHLPHTLTSPVAPSRSP
jgi:MFS family permease